MHKVLFKSLILIFILMGCAAWLPLSPFARPFSIVERLSPWFASTTYALGPQDLLDITVYEHPALNLQVRISSRGTFGYPPLGIIHAAGITVSQLEQEMTRRLLARQSRRLYVAISVKEYRNDHVYILGAVTLPGVYSLQKNATLEELLALAHGVTHEADGYVLMVRGYGSNMDPLPRAKVRHLESLPGIRINLNTLRSGIRHQSIQIHSGDMVYVPRHKSYFAHDDSNISNIYYHIRR